MKERRTASEEETAHADGVLTTASNHEPLRLKVPIHVTPSIPSADRDRTIFLE